MEEIKQHDSAPMPMLCPAFRVRDGIITAVNDAAAAYGVVQGVQINSVIYSGAQEFSTFSSGRLDLTLSICNRQIGASVVPDGDSLLFVLESDFAQPEHRAFALAAQHLRAPLSEAILHTESITGSLDTNAQIRLAQINRNLQQIMRIVCNMSDIANYKSEAKLCSRNVVAIFSEVLEKAQSLLVKAGKQLQYQLPKQPIICNADERMLERAILNLLSNAARFSDGSDIIKAELICKNNRVYFCVENNCNSMPDRSQNLFARYLREPAIEEGRSGIGLGLPIVRSVAAVHNGTLLMDQPEEGGIRITMSLSCQNSSTAELRSPIRIPIDYAGGWDHALMELSEILPPELYGY